MKLSKKFVASSILSLGLALGTLAPTTHAFDLESVDLSNQISNTLNARFNISEAVEYVTLSWNDESDGQFEATALETIPSSVLVAPDTIKTGSFVSTEVTVLLKVPIDDFGSLRGVRIIDSEYPDTPVSTKHVSDDNFQYIVLGENLHIHDDGWSGTETINFDITFGEAGEYNFDILAVADAMDWENDNIDPGVTPGLAVESLTYDEISIGFSEGITYTSKARVQQAILDSYGASAEDLIFDWRYNESNGTETLQVYNITDRGFTYSGSIDPVTISDLNGNSISGVLVLE